MSESYYPGPPLTVNGVTFRTHIDHMGYWTATASGYQQCEGSSYADVENRARLVVSKARIRVSIPFKYLDWTPVTREDPVSRQVVLLGEATGIHAGNDKILIRRANGKSEQIDGWGTPFYSASMSEEDTRRLEELTAEARRVESALTDIKHRNRLNLREEVRNAVEEARKEQAGG